MKIISFVLGQLFMIGCVPTLLACEAHHLVEQTNYQDFGLRSCPGNIDKVGALWRPHSLIGVSTPILHKDTILYYELHPLTNFFQKALTQLSIWSGLRLTRWSMKKVHHRAKAYTYYYQHDRGVRQAAQHWDYLLRQSTAIDGKEPDHCPNIQGFQDWSECMICAKQVGDLRY